MKSICKYEDLDGNPVFIEMESVLGPNEIRECGVKSDGKIIETEKRFEEVLAQVKPAVRAMLNSLSEFNTPQEIKLEFGVKFDLKAGVVFASASSTSTIKVTISWENE